MERLTKRDTDGQAMMDCEKCKADWTGKHSKPMVDCTALYCRNRIKARLAAYEDTGLEPEEINDLASVREISPEAECAINKHADNIMADAENCKVYGSYVSSVEDVEEAKRALAKQAAQCVERAMLDNDMFLVDGGTVGWKLLLYGGDNKVTTICQSCGAMMDGEPCTPSK